MGRDGYGDTRPRRRRRPRPEPTSTGRRIGLTLLVLALLGTFGGVGSWAAWQVSDANTGNTFTTTTVLLADDQGGQGGSATSSGTAMFNVTNISPNSAATQKCIGLKITGTAGIATLTLAPALGGTGVGNLDTQLTMTTAQYNTSGTVTVTNGSNTNSGSCAGYPGGGSDVTVGTQGATLATWAAPGGGSYSIASPASDMWFQFVVSGLPNGASCATYCGKTLTLSLTWTLTTT